MKTLLKNLKTKNLLWLLFGTLIISGFLKTAMIVQVVAPDGGVPKVFVEPAESVFYGKNVGDTFTVNVTIANVTNIVGYEFKLEWNSSLLNGVTMTEVLFHSTMPNETEISENLWRIKHTVAADSVWYAYTYYDIARAIANGYAPINITTANYTEGKLTAATITLEIVSLPPQVGYFDCILDITTSKLGGPGGVSIDHTVEDGYYKISSPPITFKVEPTTYVATCKNETFQINVTINDVLNVSKLVGAEFKLRYDTTLLSVENVTEGSFMESFAIPPSLGTQFMKFVENDHVLVGILLYPDDNGTWHEPFPSGNGTLATITFRVILGPPVSCDLELYDTKAGDTHATPLNNVAESGSFDFSTETLYHNIMVDTTPFLVVTVSNASVSPVPMASNFSGKMLSFNVSGEIGTIGFVNVTIPKNFLWLQSPGDQWVVLVGGESVTPNVSGNDTHTFLYMTVNLSEISQKLVQIIGTGMVPEFPIQVILPIFLATTLVAAAVTMRHRKRNKPFLSQRGP